MIATLPISRLVNVQVNLAPIAAQAQNLSNLLVMGTSDVIDVVQRAREYSSITEVAAEFGTDSDEHKCAVLWFEQTPQPTVIWIGRWADADTPGQLIGGPVSDANKLITPWNAITDGGALVNVDGVPAALDGLDFSASANLNGVASVIQTALAALYGPNPTCVWDSVNGRFIFSSGTDGEGSTFGFLEAPTAVGNFLFNNQPVDGSSITLNGTAVLFADSPSAGQVQIGANLAETLTFLLAILNGSEDTQLVKFNYAIDATHLYLSAATPGTGGNALTLAASVSPDSNATRSAATLTGGTATDLSAMLAGLSTSDGAYLAAGIDAETPAEAIAIEDEIYGQKWYAAMFTTATDDQNLDCAAIIQAMNNKHILGISTQESGVLSAVSTTDIAYRAKALGYSRAVVQYNGDNAFSVCSLLARILTTNYNGNNTVITLIYKQEPGITADQLTSTQATAAADKNANVFVAYNNDTAIIQYGTVANGAFVDEITGLDWFAVTVQTAVYNLLYTTPTKIPQTDAGVHLITNVIDAVCQQAVVNGLVAPGVWKSNGFGTLKTDDFMPQGCYIYAQPVANQLQADREARKAPPIQIALKLAGAVHTVEVIVSVNR